MTREKDEALYEGLDCCSKKYIKLSVALMNKNFMLTNQKCKMINKISSKLAMDVSYETTEKIIKIIDKIFDKIDNEFVDIIGNLIKDEDD